MGQSIDEALDARRKKKLSIPTTEQSDHETGERLQTIENLLMRLVRQGDTSLRVQDVCLALLQDALAEAHATLKISWDSLVYPNSESRGSMGTN
jgi:hypothetical protein